MNDMGPRRMDGFARQQQAQPNPSQPRPTAQQRVQQQPQPRPRPTPQPLPISRDANRQQQASSRPVQQHRNPPTANQQRVVPERPMPVVKKRAPRRGWWVVLQFVIGLAVIAGVAFAIVWLYVRYYQ